MSRTQSSTLTFLLLFLFNYHDSNAQIFGAPELISNEIGPSRICLADLDGDDFVDLITSYADTDRLVWAQNLGDGTYGSEQLVASVNYPWDVKAVDTDNDGDLDLIYAGYFDDQIFLSENLGGGVFASEVSIASYFRPLNLAFGDFDADGDQDMLSSSWVINKVFLQENLGDGTFGPPVFTASISSPFGLDLADLDNDGDLEILYSNISPSSKIGWHENLGGASFGPLQLISSLTSSASIALTTVDLNDDGKQDILSAANVADKIYWYENLGAGNFSAEQLIADVEGPYEVVAEDIDLDGDLDIVAAAEVGDDIIWCENLGGEVFGPVNSLAPGFGRPFHVAMADADNDGDQDIFAPGFDENEIILIRNNIVQDCLSATSPIGLSHTYTPASIGGTLDLSWGEITGVPNYQIKITRVSGSVPKSKNFLSSTNALSITAMFQAGDVFKWKVRAACPVSTDWSDLDFFTIPTLRGAGESGSLFESAQISKFGVTAFPNPAVNLINFEIEGPELSGQSYQLTITNLEGKMISRMEGTVDKGSLQLDLVDWPTGNYFYQFVIDGETISGNFAKGSH